MDSKIETTRLGNEAGVPSVPNTMGRATSYREVLDLAASAGLGDDLVIQTPYGDSGQTTFFVASEDDWNADEEKMVGEDLKVMKRIDPRECAIEGVITRHGTLVGPLMAELTGFPELTPYDGGWCGNDVFPDVLTEQQRRLARERTFAMGERLRREGYRGYFELDFLADANSGEMYLGELNPRVTGASSITNVTAVAYGDMPLFLFHLLEFMDVDYEIDVDELNRRWAHPGNIDDWTQFILKQTEDVTELITGAPASGIWRMQDDGDDRLRPARHRLAHGRRRGRGLLPPDRVRGSVPISGCRPGDPGHARPVHGRAPRADGPRARAGSRASSRSSRACPPEAPPSVAPEPFGFKML